MVPLEPVRHVGRQIAAQVDITEELQRLKSENQTLSSWEWRAKELERKLADLEALSKVVDEPKINFVTSRVIADSSGAFVRSVMINAGSEQNIKTGFPVVSADGLVGRVVEIGPSSARVLLSTDLNSRIPVVVGDKGVRGVLAGDNGSVPRLIFLPPDAKDFHRRRRRDFGNGRTVSPRLKDRQSHGRSWRAARQTSRQAGRT